MGRKDASTTKLPVDQYRKQIGKQDYKKTKPILRATKLKAEAKKTAIGIKQMPSYYYQAVTAAGSPDDIFGCLPEFAIMITKHGFLSASDCCFDQALLSDVEVGLVLAAILALLLAFYAFFYLRLSTDVDPDLDPNED